VWLALPGEWNRSAFVEHVRQTGIGVVASDAFAVVTEAPT